MYPIARAHYGKFFHPNDKGSLYPYEIEPQYPLEVAFYLFLLLSFVVMLLVVVYRNDGWETYTKVSPAEKGSRATTRKAIIFAEVKAHARLRAAKRREVKAVMLLRHRTRMLGRQCRKGMERQTKPTKPIPKFYEVETAHESGSLLDFPLDSLPKVRDFADSASSRRSSTSISAFPELDPEDWDCKIPKIPNSPIHR